MTSALASATTYGGFVALNALMVWRIGHHWRIRLTWTRRSSIQLRDAIGCYGHLAVEGRARSPRSTSWRQPCLPLSGATSRRGMPYLTGANGSATDGLTAPLSPESNEPSGSPTGTTLGSSTHGG